MIFKKGRYSGFLRPISYAIDLVVINTFAYLFLGGGTEFFNYTIFVTISWIISSSIINFYEIYRYTKAIKILSLVMKQTMMFLLIVFAFYGYYYTLKQNPGAIVKYVFTVMGIISGIKIAIYYLLKQYRGLLGGNKRNVIIVGLNEKTKELEHFFNDNSEYGYHLMKSFILKGQEKTSLDTIFSFIDKNEIDEIYASVGDLSEEKMAKLIEYSDNNLKILKFLPDNKEIYGKRLDFSYYGYLPVLSLRKIPMDEPFNKFIKRAFDIIMSLTVIVGILSWLTPILGILIKLESKGPVFFKQKRNGLDYKEFYCYKFRSMRPSPTAHLHQATKGDTRITKVGKIIRKTSMDELPQFINVLKGDMSVVGPRPHMVSHTHMYAERIDKFMVRHFIKPGITGLAQVSGYRGEVETDKDIINRVKYDIYYLENWSLIMDLKVVFQTVYNAIKGEEKAY
ncbi:undecaprenyl-phosphate glucose phosphotransferase [Patiriisocius marinistellae]|uniref:Undecaprenyl-phosphate glucose phosphotransferase n=1 Tax=Patiriisocius marinistellae TaxID=2494560 RepID=A0A5J4FXU2_9FLAO|nr:exopolysaccharide biosynthesis polyprenyl glycosylphosphotransferase [Patiriisocius marinistellae]GEQ84845.1 undecaprenyl-phosphate glucose phosphotransferase [Patiriisocius marinistellae]